MELSLEQIKNLLKQPENKKEIEKAAYQDLRLKFHSENCLKEEYLSRYKDEYFAGIKKQLTDDKYILFTNTFSYPLPSTGLVDETKDQLSKMFEAKNSNFAIETADEEERRRVNEYFESIQEPSYWSRVAFELFYCSPSSLLVVDKPKDSNKPYWYEVAIGSVHSILVKKEKVEYVIINQTAGKDEEKRYLVIDDKRFRIVAKKKPEATPKVAISDDNSVVIIDEVEHGVPYAPVRQMFDDRLNLDDSVTMRSPASDQLGELDDYLTKSTNMKNADLLNAWPVSWGYDTDESIEDIRTTVLQELQGRDNYDEMYSNGQAEAIFDQIIESRKRKSAMAGVGTKLLVQAPTDNTEPDLREPFGYITPPVESLKYATDKLEKLEAAIYRRITGKTKEQHNSERPVDSQIKSQYEGERMVLKWEADIFSRIRTWAATTAAIMLTGNTKIKCEAFIGTEFFIEGEKESLANLEAYSEAGAPQGSIMDRIESLNYSNTKDRPTALLISRIKNDLEPGLNYSLDKAAEYVEKGLMDETDWIIKSNFAEFVGRFEREKGNLLGFVTGKDYGQAINEIKNQFKEYAKSKKLNIRQPGQGTAVSNPGGV